MSSSTDLMRSSSSNVSRVAAPPPSNAPVYQVTALPGGGYAYHYQYQSSTSPPVAIPAGFQTTRTTTTYNSSGQTGPPAPPLHAAGYVSSKLAGSALAPAGEAVYRIGACPGTGSSDPPGRTQLLTSSSPWSPDALGRYIEEHFTMPVLYDRGSMVCADNTLMELQPQAAEQSKITFRPKLDSFYLESDRKVVIVVDLPGFVKDDVDIELQKGVLTLSGTRTAQAATDPATAPDAKPVYYHRERFFGHFHRSFQLAPNINQDSITANMSHGVLEITMTCKDTQEEKKKVLVN